jgi:hypothetical protein
MKMFPMKFYMQRARILGWMLGFCMVIYLMVRFFVASNI